LKRCQLCLALHPRDRIGDGYAVAHPSDLSSLSHVIDGDDLALGRRFGEYDLASVMAFVSPLIASGFSSGPLGAVGVS
jgi:hypothetical protein